MVHAHSASNPDDWEGGRTLHSHKCGASKRDLEPLLKTPSYLMQMKCDRMQGGRRVIICSAHRGEWGRNETEHPRASRAKTRSLTHGRGE